MCTVHRSRSPRRAETFPQASRRSQRTKPAAFARLTRIRPEASRPSERLVLEGRATLLSELIVRGLAINIRNPCRFWGGDYAGGVVTGGPAVKWTARAGSRATVLASNSILVMLQERLEMDEEFSHGGDDGAFVGFAAGDQALDVLANDGIVLRRALGGHVQTASRLGASAADGAFAFPLAAVSIPRGQPR